MEKPEITSFEEGLDYAINRIKVGQTKPLLVGVQGFPNVGKSEFCKKVYQELSGNSDKIGWFMKAGETYGFSNGGEIEQFVFNNYVAKQPELGTIPVAMPSSGSTGPQNVRHLDYLLLEATTDSVALDEYTKKMFGKVCELKVYMSRKISQAGLTLLDQDGFKVDYKRYDLIIENPAAVIK